MTRPGSRRSTSATSRRLTRRASSSATLWSCSNRKNKRCFRYTEIPTRGTKMKQSGPFSLTTTGATPATGIATLTKDPSDTCVLAVVSGTYGTVQVKGLGTIDGVNYFPIEAEDLSNGNLVNGTLSPSDNTVHAYRFLADGLVNIQIYVVAIASGTVVVTGQGQHFVNLPKTSNQQAGSSVGANTYTGDQTLSDVNLVLGTVTGTKIGTATTQKLGFYNATPIVQPANTVDYVTMLTNLGLRATGGTAAATYPGAVAAASFASTAGILSVGPTGAGIGYATGAGGAVAQITNRSTGVTLSKLTGQITTHTASLAGLAAATFVVTNTTV